MKISTKRKRYFLITAIALATMLNPLNTTMIALGLTRIQNDFQVSFIELSWFISIFYLVSSIAHPVMGKLTDIYGKRRLFIFGLILIAVASLLAPFSPNLFWLTVSRSIQAWGSSTVYPAGMGIIREEIADNQGKALGIISFAANTSAAIGPTLGGILISLADWQLLFFINIPFLLASFILAYKLIPKDRISTAPRLSIDYTGIILFSLTIICFLVSLLSLGKVIFYPLFFATIVFLKVFISTQRKKQNPFIDITGIMQCKGVVLVYLNFVLINIIFYMVMFSFPTYLQQVIQYSSAKTGLIMLSIAGFAGIVSPLTGRLIDHIGVKTPLLIGAFALVIGTGGMVGITLSTGTSHFILVLAAIGISTGIYNLTLQATLYYFVPLEETGSAIGLFMTSRFLGTIVASGLLGLLFGQVISDQQFHAIALVSSFTAIITFLLIIGLMKQITPFEQQYQITK